MWSIEIWFNERKIRRWYIEIIFVHVIAIHWGRLYIFELVTPTIMSGLIKYLQCVVHSTSVVDAKLLVHWFNSCAACEWQAHSCDKVVEEKVSCKKILVSLRCQLVDQRGCLVTRCHYSQLSNHVMQIENFDKFSPKLFLNVVKQNCNISVYII